jgi:uncharacterized protein (TIGR02996 family)
VTERESFVASMRDSPGADTPRLAFADWLEERGESDRADLIRVQVARARLNPRPVLRVFQRIEVTPPVHGGREFRGDFLVPPGLRLMPVLTFDAVMQMAPGEPLKTKAVGCVIEQFGPPVSAGETIWLAGHVTGIHCPVRPEADALDARAAALMLKIPFGDFCPATFDWFTEEAAFVDAARYASPETAQAESGPLDPSPAVLVRRGFAEHVRCSWADWLRWADWFRANHPCERVTLTTVPQLTWYQIAHFRTAELPGARGSKMYDEKELADLPLNLRSPIVAKEVLEKTWAGTVFDVPAFGNGHMLSQAMAATAS